MKRLFLCWLTAFSLGGAAFAAPLDVCGDPAAPVDDVARQCQNALDRGGLTPAQTYAARVNLGYALMDLRQADRAVEIFDAAVDGDILRVEAYIGRAAAEEALGRNADAARDWDRARGLAPDSVDVHLGRGAFLIRAGLPAQAVEALDAALALAPDEPDALFNRGLANLALERNADAEADFTRLIAMNAADAGAHLHRGRAREGRDDAAALADYDQAARLAPEWAAPWFLSGRLLDRRGDRREAERRLRRAFELGYRDPWLLERIQRRGG